MSMYPIDLIRVHTHAEAGGHYATLTYAGERLWASSRLHLDRASLDGWVADMRQALRDAVCAWCAVPADFIEQFGELDDRPDDIIAYCSDDCRLAAFKEYAS